MQLRRLCAVLLTLVLLFSVSTQVFADDLIASEYPLWIVLKFNINTGESGDRCLIPVVFEEAVEKPVEPEIVVPAPQPVYSNPNRHLWGVCTITHYCWCAQCCGRAGHPTASGVNPSINHTVACGALPFGTRLWINGQEYVVEDTGVNGYWVDIFVGSHDEANARGMFQAEVYIIDE